MKAFEKHLAKDHHYVRPTSFDAEIMRQEWRAALEWALVTSKELDEQDAPISMQEVIEQELEN